MSSASSKSIAISFAAKRGYLIGDVSCGSCRGRLLLFPSHQAGWESGKTHRELLQTEPFLGAHPCGQRDYRTKPGRFLTPGTQEPCQEAEPREAPRAGMSGLAAVGCSDASCGTVCIRHQDQAPGDLGTGEGGVGGWFMPLSETQLLFLC